MERVKLKSFTVQGWKRRPDDLKDIDREPMPIRKIQAVDAAMAAETYARCYQMPRHFWDNKSARPPIIIRVFATMKVDGKETPLRMPIR